MVRRRAGWVEFHIYPGPAQPLCGTLERVVWAGALEAPQSPWPQLLSCWWCPRHQLSVAQVWMGRVNKSRQEGAINAKTRHWGPGTSGSSRCSRLWAPWTAHLLAVPELFRERSPEAGCVWVNGANALRRLVVPEVWEKGGAFENLVWW